MLVNFKNLHHEFKVVTNCKLKLKTITTIAAQEDFNI